MTDADAERLAALLDGKLDAKARARLLEDLDASPELREAYADAVAVRGELERDLRPIAAKTRWVRKEWVAIAAMLLVVGALLLMRAASDRVPMDSPAIIARLDDRAVSAARSRDPVLPLRRGDALSGFGDALAVQLGVRLADLGLLLRGQDTGATNKAREIAELLTTLPAGAAAASRFRAIEQTSSTADRQSLFVDAVRSAERIAGETPVRVGVWLQVGRIAAAAGDTGFFESADPMMDAAAAIARDSTARDRVADLRAHLAKRRLALPQLSVALDSALSSLTRR